MRSSSPAAPRPHLHALQQPSERLLPGQGVHVLLCVDDADLPLQLWDDGTRAPAMPQHEVLGAGWLSTSEEDALPSPPLGPAALTARSL